jgi:hypothetical protein
MSMGATDATLAAIKQAQANPEDVTKATFTATGISQGAPGAGGAQPTGGSGLIGYDLAAPAKTLYPVLTPLRNMIPRVGANGDTATRWKSIIGINSAKVPLGVGEAARGGFMDMTLKDYVASYKGIGLENYITFESEYAAEGFDNVRARAVESLLRAFMIAEENLILGGCNSVSLGTPATPAVTKITTGKGASMAASISVKVVLLTLDGYQRAAVNATGVVSKITRTPADGGSAVTVNAGASAISAAGAIASGIAATDSVLATVTPVKGAVAYAWYWGVSGSEKLGAITTTNSVWIKAPADTANQAASATDLATDYSADSTVYDGILTQTFADGAWTSMPTGTTTNLNDGTSTSALSGTAGFPLTSDGAGGIKEIDSMFKSFWDNSRLSPDYLLVSSQEMKNLSAALIKSGAGSLFRFEVDSMGGPNSVNALTLTGGAVIGSYLNKYSMTGGNLVKVVLHPNMPAGTILFMTNTLPYPASGVTNVLQMKCRRDYYQLEWPIRTRRYEYGVYADEVLQNFFPAAFGVLTGIADGLL